MNCGVIRCREIRFLICGRGEACLAPTKRDETPCCTGARCRDLARGAEFSWRNGHEASPISVAQAFELPRMCRSISCAAVRAICPKCRRSSACREAAVALPASRIPRARRNALAKADPRCISWRSAPDFESIVPSRQKTRLRAIQWSIPAIQIADCSESSLQVRSGPRSCSV